MGEGEAVKLSESGNASITKGIIKWPSSMYDHTNSATIQKTCTTSEPVLFSEDRV
jgi:hypothetical protein